VLITCAIRHRHRSRKSKRIWSKQLPPPDNSAPHHCQTSQPLKNRASNSMSRPGKALFLPKGTPEAIVRRLAQAVDQALDSPSVRDRFEAIGESVIPRERRGPEYFGQFVASEIERLFRSDQGERCKCGMSTAMLRRPNVARRGSPGPRSEAHAPAGARSVALPSDSFALRHR
jgi:Tripartite tricarboxylate transporter family receptor